MQKKNAFIVYYHKKNRYSFNALLGAIETVELFNDIDIYFIKNKDSLVGNLTHLIEKYEKLILGISFFTTQLWEINELIKTLRETYGSRLIIIAGGPHPTGDPRGTLKLGVNVVFIGEAEESIIDFFHKVRNNEEITNIKGIAYFDSNNNYQYIKKESKIDLDKYLPFPIKLNKFGAIEITRGCPYLCYFCQTPYISGRYPKHRSIAAVCKIVQIMKNKNLTDIRFITPNAFSYGSLNGKTLNIPQIRELLVRIKKIISPNGRIFLGSFPSEVRPEHVNEETLSLITNYCNNDNIIIGAQSGSQRILDLCNRGHTVEDIYNAVKMTLNSKLKANVDFIFGLPNENEEDINLSLKVLKDLTKMGARVHTHSFIPLPQTPFSKKPAGLIDQNIQKTIKELTAKGLAFGEWKKQEIIALKIAKYLKTQMIK